METYTFQRGRLFSRRQQPIWSARVTNLFPQSAFWALHLNMRFSGSANGSRQGALHVCGVVFSRLLGILCYWISWHVSEFLVCELSSLTPVDILALVQASSGLGWLLVNLCCRASLICCLGTFLYGSLFLWSHFGGASAINCFWHLSLQPFPNFSFTTSCHRTKSQRHVLTQPRCQEDPSPAGLYDPNEWATICTVN